MKLSIAISSRGFCLCVTAASLLLGLADYRSTIGQDRVQPVAPANRVRPMRDAFLAPAAVNQAPVDQQVRRQLESLLKVELSFVNRAAELNESQRRALVAASVQWLDEFVVDFGKNMDPEQRLMWQRGVQGFVVSGERSGDGPRQHVELGVAKSVAATVPNDKATFYRSQRAKREEFYRDVAIANLVACVDEKLYLSPGQRLNITKSLTKNWAPRWSPEVEVFMTTTNVLPSAAEMWIRPELDESQRDGLDRMNNMPSRMFVGGSVLGADGEVIDDINLEPQAVAEDAEDNGTKN